MNNDWGQRYSGSFLGVDARDAPRARDQDRRMQQQIDYNRRLVEPLEQEYQQVIAEEKKKEKKKSVEQADADIYYLLS